MAEQNDGVYLSGPMTLLRSVCGVMAGFDTKVNHLCTFCLKHTVHVHYDVICAAIRVKALILSKNIVDTSSSWPRLVVGHI